MRRLGRLAAALLVLALALQTAGSSAQTTDEGSASNNTGLYAGLGVLVGGAIIYLVTRHHHPQSAPQTVEHEAAPTPTPPAGVTTEDCPPDVSGWLEPTQAVWQDDDFFEDKATKQLDQLGPASYRAELNMVKDRDTLLFGILRPAGQRPQDRRDSIVVRGTTRRSQVVNMSLHITLAEPGGTRTIYQTPAQYPVFWHGPCDQTTHAFDATLDASHGIPPPPADPFQFKATGPYTVTAELYDGDAPTGLKVTLAGETVETHGPEVHIVPVISTGDKTTLVDRTTKLVDAARVLAETTARYGPIYFPLRADGLPTLERQVRSLDPMLKTAKAKAAADVAKLRTMGFQPGFLADLEQETNSKAARETIAAELIDQFNGIVNVPGFFGRMVVVLDPADAPLVLPKIGIAETVSTKVIFMRSSYKDIPVSYITVLHELVHTEPKYIFSDDQMRDDCKFDYHNWADTPTYVTRRNGPAGMRYIRGIQPGGSITGVAYGVRTERDEAVGYLRELGTPGDQYTEKQLPAVPVSLAAAMGKSNAPEMRERFRRTYEIMGLWGLTSPGTNTLEFPKQRWITQCTYWHLVDAFQKQQDPHLLVVRGLLVQDRGTYAAVLHAVTERDGEPDLVSGGGSAGWAIVLRDRQGHLLATYPFTPDWRYADDEAMRSVIAVAFAVPDVSGATRIEVVRSGKTLGRLER